MEALGGLIIGPIMTLLVLSVVLEWLFNMKISELLHFRMGRFIVWALAIGSGLVLTIGAALS